ncbi:MAG: MBL fold metallo-hydrolase, partial [Caldilineaceae bacterium]|nr:MBL fold metallo-hydrolase [Caldilineaceae bacterium]
SPLQQFQLGEVLIRVFNAGETRLPLAEILNVTESDWSPRYRDTFAEPARAPILCIHNTRPTMTILVDAGVYDFPADSPFALLDYTPPPGLPTQLTAAGLALSAVDHLVITHAHGDHFNATTVSENGIDVPAFPNAQLHLGCADWTRPATQEALQRADSLESRTLGVYHALGQLDLVEGVCELGAGVQIITAPGETPGHQIVRLHSQGQTLYCLGDLYHHPVEVEQDGWGVTWSDIAAAQASRRAFAPRALAEDALLIATHIWGVGRLAPTAEGVRWTTVER